MRALPRRAIGVATAGVAAAVVLLASPRATAQEIKTEKTVHFLGFSEDQTKAAWSIHVRRFLREGGRELVDRFAVVRVVKSIDNVPFANYRVGEIERVTLADHPVPAPPAKLTRENPLWFNASPERHWKVMEKGFNFGAARLTAKTAVAAVPDPDVEMTARPGVNGTMTFGSQANRLGYTLVMQTGEKATLGRYRHEVDVDQRVRGVLEVYISTKGDYAAVANRFETIGARPDEVSALTYGKVVPITVTGAIGGQYVWVRMPWGWKKMTPYEERVYRESRAQNLRFAQMMMGFANGAY